MITPTMPSTQIAGFARRVVLAFFSSGAVKRPAAGWSKGRPRIGFGTMIEVTSDCGISAAGSAPRSSGGENAVGTWGTSPGVQPGLGSCHGAGTVGRAPVGGAARWVAPHASSPACDPYLTDSAATGSGASGTYANGGGAGDKSPAGGGVSLVAPHTSSAGKGGSSSPEPGGTGVIGDGGSLTAPSTSPRLAGGPATRRPGPRDGRRCRVAAGPDRRPRGAPHHG